MRVPFVGTSENMADFFTKPLPSKTFFFMRDRIMNVPASVKPERPLAERLMDVAPGDKYAAAIEGLTP